MNNGHNFLIITIVLVVTQQAQGQRYCYTPHNYVGTCVGLNSCPSLVSYYAQYQNYPGIRDFLLTSQRNCGNVVINRDPLVCCTNPVTNTHTQRPEITTQATILTTTTTPTTTTTKRTTTPTTTSTTSTTTTTTTTPRTTTPTTTKTTTRTTISATSVDGEFCHDPNGMEGECKSIRDCASIRDEFVARGKDSDYIKYIKKSNAMCHNVEPYVCCPSEGEPMPLPNDADIQGRLLGPSDGCGVSDAPLYNKIVGGTDAEPGAYPWMALIGYVNNLGDLSWKCGGSLISTRHVLTASHCILSTLSLVRLGEHDIGTSTDGKVQDIEVTRSEKHPNYNKKDGTNDIAILFLERDAALSNRVVPVCLPISEPILSQDFVGYRPTVAGWGRLQEGGKSSTILQELSLPVLENSECKKQYQKQGKLISEKQFSNVVICAGKLEGGEDSCQGDSGGPLMQSIPDEDDTSRYYQIGVVSYGIGCARTNTPGVYTRVQHFMDWIEGKVPTKQSNLVDEFARIINDT